MYKILIFIAGGIAGYLANGWIEGFTGKQVERKEDASASTQEA